MFRHALCSPVAKGFNRLLLAASSSNVGWKSDSGGDCGSEQEYVSDRLAPGGANVCQQWPPSSFLLRQLDSHIRTGDAPRRRRTRQPLPKPGSPGAWHPGAQRHRFSLTPTWRLPCVARQATQPLRERGGAPRNPAPRNHFWGGLPNHEQAICKKNCFPESRWLCMRNKP